MAVIQPLPTETQLDYYHILGIKRSADITAINTAYRTLALKLHPTAHSDDCTDNTIEQQFTQLCEAYTVLTNSKLRSIYDQYGYNKLRHGSTDSHTHAIIEPMSPITIQQSNQLFESFFGCNNPFSVFNNNTPLALKLKPVTPTIPTQTINLYVTLEEIYTGCTKLAKVYTQQCDPDTNEYNIVEKVVSVNIGAGYKTGTKITFAQQGDAGLNAITGDLVFIVQEKQHNRFQRRNNDLVYKCKLSLLEALTGKHIDIVTLDNRVLSVSLHDMICTPQNGKIIPNEGLPNPKNTQKRGNLVVEFEVVFPQTLTVQQQTQLKQTLA